MTSPSWRGMPSMRLRMKCQVANKHTSTGLPVQEAGALLSLYGCHFYHFMDVTGASCWQGETGRAGAGGPQRWSLALAPGGGIAPRRWPLARSEQVASHGSPLKGPIGPFKGANGALYDILDIYDIFFPKIRNFGFLTFLWKN